MHCSVNSLLCGQSRRRMTNLHFWLMPQSFNIYKSVLTSILFGHWVIQIIFFELWGGLVWFGCFFGFIYFSFSFILFFIIFHLPLRSGVISCNGNDCGRQWLTVQDAAPMGTGRTLGPWDSDADRRDELTADNRREEQMLTKTLSTVLMAWVRCNNAFINTFLFLPCTSFALIHTPVKWRSARTKRKSSSPTGFLWLHCFQRFCAYSGKQQSKLLAIRNGFQNRRKKIFSRIR